MLLYDGLFDRVTMAIDDNPVYHLRSVLDHRTWLKCRDFCGPLFVVDVPDVCGTRSPRV
jgi:hypothetical protein